MPSFKSVYSVDNFVSGKTYLVDTYTKDPNKYPDTKGYLNKEPVQNMRVVELAMQRWSGRYSRPFLFGMLSDGTILCYHAYFYEGTENAVKGGDPVSPRGSADTSSMSISRLRNLRFLRVSIDITTREEMSNAVSRPRITVFNNVGGYQGLFLSGSRPAWLMVCRERIRVHPQV